jgi:hypothetical protein
MSKSLKISRRPVISSFPILFLSLLILCVAIIFLTTKLYSQAIQSTNAQPSDIKDSQLTNTFYIGPKPYTLIFRSKGSDLDYGEYILRNEYPDKIDISLLLEPNVCATPRVIHSPDNTKFLISYYCGDAPHKLLIGVASESNMNPIESQFIRVPDETYYVNIEFVAWLKDDTLLVKKVDSTSEPRDTGLFLMTYPGFTLQQKIL